MNHKRPLISIIIPEYNQKPELLIRCLKSVFETQEHIDATTDCEVILIKDSLEDDLTYIQETFPTVKIIQTKGHTGPGLARQAGLDKATCEWIYFMDSDDTFFSVLSLWHMFNQIQLHPDAQLITFSHYEECRHKIKGYCMISLYCCLFRRTIIDKYQIHFLGNMNLYEDMAFVSSYTYAVGFNNIVTAEEFPIYYYRDCDTSITKSGRTPSQVVSWDVKATMYILQVLQRANKVYITLFFYWMFRIVNDMGGLSCYRDFVFKNKHELTAQTVSNYNSLMEICSQYIENPTWRPAVQNIASLFGAVGEYFMLNNCRHLKELVNTKLTTH